MGQDSRSDSEPGPADSLTRLKELLFTDETIALKGLSQRVEQVYSRAGNDDQLRTSVARVLDGVLIEAEKVKHEQVSRAMAPMVVKTVKAEFLNSQDDLVEALYPITGRMVKSYVATAMKDLANEINRKLENNSLMLRLRSLATGRPMSDLAISDSQRLQVEEILLIRRGSGELIERWPDTRALSNADIHMSGILAAINDFATHAFQSDGGSIRDFAVDDFSMFLRASPNYLLAAKCTGTTATGIQYVIDDEFLGLLERIHEREEAGTAAPDNSLTLLAETKENLDTRIEKRFDEITAPLPFRPIKVLAYLLLAALLTAVGWWVFTAYEKSRTQGIAERILASTPSDNARYVEPKAGYRGRSLVLTGLSPSPAATNELLAKLNDQLPGVDISHKLLVLPGSNNDAEQEIARLRRDLARTEAGASHAAVFRTLSRARHQLSTALSSFDKIEPLQQNDAGKKEARQAGSLIEQSVRELTSYQGAVEAAPREAGALKELERPFAVLSARLSGISNRLTGLLEGRRTAPGAATPTVAAGIVAASEMIAAEADQIAALSVALSVPRTPTETPRQRLQDWMRNNAIFFTNDDVLRTPDLASRQLDELASLILADDSLVRIVGYTDERGTQTRNDSIATARADRVKAELTRRNVPAARLLTIGRATGPDLSPDVGTSSPNRRVQFEIGFIGERGP